MERKTEFIRFSSEFCGDDIGIDISKIARKGKRRGRNTCERTAKIKIEISGGLPLSIYETCPVRYRSDIIHSI